MPKPREARAVCTPEVNPSRYLFCSGVKSLDTVKETRCSRRMTRGVPLPLFQCSCQPGGRKNMFKFNGLLAQGNSIRSTLLRQHAGCVNFVQCKLAPFEPVKKNFAGECFAIGPRVHETAAPASENLSAGAHAGWWHGDCFALNILRRVAPENVQRGVFRKNIRKCRVSERKLQFGKSTLTFR